MAFFQSKAAGVRRLNLRIFCCFCMSKCFVLDCNVIMDTRSKLAYRKLFNSFGTFQSFFVKFHGEAHFELAQNVTIGGFFIRYMRGTKHKFQVYRNEMDKNTFCSLKMA